ncbi:MAG: hypothetical protein ACJ8GN_21520 [Longimicrobiaceae bacterium]
MSTPVANYRDERAAIESLSLEGCEKRILLFHGAGGSGKTTLLSYCGMHLPELLQVPIQLRAGTVGVAEILSRSLDRLGADRLPRLLECVEYLQSTRIEIKGNRSFGINNRIEVALDSNRVEDRDDRLVSLTEALFEDLRTFKRPLLFVLDTYDQARTESKNGSAVRSSREPRVSDRFAFSLRVESFQAPITSNGAAAASCIA